MIIIGIAGRKRCGKSTTAALLERELGFKRYAFGTKLKQLVKIMYPFIPDEVIWGEDRECPVFFSTPLMISEGAPVMITGRNLVQWAGQAIRKVMGEHAWVTALVSQINEESPALAVIEDVRQFNELSVIKNSGGHIIRANRAVREQYHQHVGADPGVPCEFIFHEGNSERIPRRCGHPGLVHPISWTEDQHETEWSLPEEGTFYDRVATTSSAEETARLGLSYARLVVP